MTVHFIGAGPGDPELITIRGQRLIAEAPVCIYAGSLVPKAVLDAAPPDAEIHDSAIMTLDEILDIIVDAHRRDLDVARVHSGDPSLYGAIGEQMRRLRALGIPFDITPGVPAYAAAAAALETEFTLPGISQTLILTRTAMQASDMPEREELEILGRSGATLAIHLSVRNLKKIRTALEPHYGADCPAAVVYRASWPDQQILRGTLATLAEQVRAEKITRTALILVGPVLAAENFVDSALYDPAHAHVLRPVKKA